MPDKKVVPVRFYFQTDKDLIEWLEGLATGKRNDTIKTMLRAGIAASQHGQGHPTQIISGASMATLDPASLQAALESFLLAFAKLSMHRLPVSALHQPVVKLLRNMKIRLPLIC